MFFFNKKQEVIEDEIKQFVDWKHKRWPDAFCNEDVIRTFFKENDIPSWKEITQELIDKFVSEQHTLYYRSVCERTIKQFMAYHNNYALFTESKCDNIIAMKRKSNQGRKPVPINIFTVKKMRDEGINGRIPSFREIGKIMRRDVSLVHRWYHYPEDRLPKIVKNKLSTGIP